MKAEFDFIVFGAGASGLSAALTAQKMGVRTLLLEKQKKLGRKLTASGNGRCNISNAHIALSQYRSKQPEILAQILGSTPSAGMLKFLTDIGIATRVDAAGRIYPYAEEAEAVRSALVAAYLAYGGQYQVETELLELRHLPNRQWQCLTSRGQFQTSKLALCLGSPAAPQLGASQTQVRIFSALDCQLLPFRPSLTPLLLAEKDFCQKASGARCKAVLRAPEQSTQGEFLFTNYGISGIAALELSLDLAAHSGELKQANYLFQNPKPLSLDFFPDYTEDGLRQALGQKLEQNPHCGLGDLLNSFLHSRIIKGLLCQPELTPSAAKLARLLKHYPFTLLGLCGFEQAQLAWGGLCLSEVEPTTLELRRQPGIYVGGESLDVNGNTGGFNLAFACLSGQRLAQAVATACGNYRS